jgi:uncharacterized protein (TIGR02246 family)
MRRLWLAVALFAGVQLAVSHSVPSRTDTKGRDAPDEKKDEKPNEKPAAKNAGDEAAIRANVAAFVRAYNAGDAKAVAALFTPEAQIIDKEGNASEGRDAIRDTFARLFKDGPQRRLEVFVDSIRFLGPDMALELGATREVFAPGEPPEQDAYTVLHLKRDGKWLMAMVRDAEGPPPSNHERLRPLAWLAGDWIDDGGSVVVSSSCRWSKDRNFLLQEFRVRVKGQEDMQVSQRIGWDPAARRVRSWVFDSEGGFGQSEWTRDGDVWVIKATGVRPDGTTASATNYLIPTGKDGYVWRSTDRVTGDEVAPAVEAKVVRKAPQPRD